MVSVLKKCQERPAVSASENTTLKARVWFDSQIFILNNDIWWATGRPTTMTPLHCNSSVSTNPRAREQPTRISKHIKLAGKGMSHNIPPLSSFDSYSNKPYHLLPACAILRCRVNESCLE